MIPRMGVSGENVGSILPLVNDFSKLNPNFVLKKMIFLRKIFGVEIRLQMEKIGPVLL
jgi:hypothetical protein